MWDILHKIDLCLMGSLVMGTLFAIGFVLLITTWKLLIAEFSKKKYSGDIIKLSEDNNV